MARKTTRQHAQGEASRRTILEATLRIAGERGYVGTTMAQVTRASGLPASSVYWHFHNKDDLLADALDHGYRRFAEEHPRWLDVDTSRPLVDEVRDQLVETTRGLDEEPGFWRMGLLLALETGPAVGSGPRERFLDVRAHAVARLTDWWSRSLAAAPGMRAEHARTLALLTLASTDGLFLAHQSGDREDLSPLVHTLAAGLAAAAERLLTDALPARRTTRHLPTRLVVTDPASGRERLLRAAADVAAESGYDGAAIARICERAGLPASSLYWHFKDKDDLLAAAIEHSYQEWYVAQPAWLPPAAGARWQDVLRDHFEVSLRSLAERPLFLRIGHMLLLLRRDDPPAARERFVAVRRQARLVQQQWFAQVVGPDAPSGAADALALMTMALSDGLFFSNQLDEPTWDVQVFTGLLVTMLDAAASDAVGESAPAAG